MRRATIRRDPDTRTWTARRPAFGFRPDDEIKTGFPTRIAAMRWLDRTLHPHGTAQVQAERSDYQLWDPGVE